VDLGDQVGWLRAVAVKSGGAVTLYSRNRKILNKRFRYIVEPLRGLPDGTVIDGEIVALNDDGRPVSNLLHQRVGLNPLFQAKEVPGQISALYPHIQPAVDQAGPNLEAATKANAKIQAAFCAMHQLLFPVW
jgi:hypothetical protein